LQKYVEESWLTQVYEDTDQKAALASLTSLRQAGRVCLLLDGADEIGGDGLQKIEEYLRMPWAKLLKVVVTCRLNLWDGSARNELKQNFQIFRTLDLKYANSTGQDEVAEFIGKWFDNVEAGKGLRAALDEVGKERIKDLAQNPLRLTLLCNIWQREQGLPDTQAGLYERFVHYLYSWSKVPDAVEMQVALDRVMGILARYGINKPSLRFRFTERELQEQVPDLNQRKLLKALGWLNCVGVDESDQKVYAFFHTTFQEYFAACSIKDWDYFLPREHDDQPVPCHDEEIPTYRVFAKHWEQTILLWFGRKDLEDKLKKDEFIEKLTNFQAGCENSMYHYFLAYQIAVIGVGEFNSSQRESLFNENIEFAFGQYNPQTDQWRDYLDCFQYSARATIYLINPKHAIERLRTLLFHPNLDSYRRNDIEKALKQITKQNKQDTYLYPQYLKKYKPLPLYQYNNTKPNQQTVEEQQF
jgi:hypothetical protein